MKVLEFLVKVAIDVTAWAWACQLLAWGSGWSWTKVACLTAGGAALWFSLRPWPVSKPSK